MHNFVTVIVMAAATPATVELCIDGYVPFIMNMQTCNGVASLMKY
jgi:hypothetical protein